MLSSSIVALSNLPNFMKVRLASRNTAATVDKDALYGRKLELYLWNTVENTFPVSP